MSEKNSITATRIDHAAERVGRRWPPPVSAEAAVGGLGTEGHAGALARRRADRVGDLAGADQDGGTRIDHFTRASISDAREAGFAQARSSVSSPKPATLGPLCSGEPEKRKGGAGDL